MNKKYRSNVEMIKSKGIDTLLGDRVKILSRLNNINSSITGMILHDTRRRGNLKKLELVEEELVARGYKWCACGAGRLIITGDTCCVCSNVWGGVLKR